MTKKKPITTKSANQDLYNQKYGKSFTEDLLVQLGLIPPMEYKHNGRETPGGDSAIDKGCTCPVLDNNHGRGIGYVTGAGESFWTNANCPIHGNNSPI